MPRTPRRLWRAAALLCLLPASASARNADTLASPLAQTDRGLRFAYANDFFTGTDRYYTQGIAFDCFHPALRKSPLMRLLPSLPGAQRSYGLSVRHLGFTPTSLGSDVALIGDRPFAAYLFLGHALVSRDRARRLTLTAELHAGVVGQGAGGKWMQKGIHRALGNLEPRGWDNQVRNDVVLGYYARLEKGLAEAPSADLAAFADATAGTLYTNAAAGLMGRLGAIGEGRKRRLFLFARGEEKLVGYDATLRGGLFNRGSPYTLSSAQVRRALFRGDLGAALDCGSFTLEVARSFLGREFAGGLAHQWLELAFAMRL